MWTDIGVNLLNANLRADVEAVLHRAEQAKVHRMLVIASDERESQACVGLCATHPGRLWHSVGIHPHQAAAARPGYIERLRQLASAPQVVALGEMGLDFNRNYSPPDVQVSVFERQLELAQDLQLPVYLHERDAHDPFYAILRERRDELAGGVVHCFTGDERTLLRYLELGFSVGVTGWICDERRGHQLQASVKHIPSDRLLLETDAPYLLPRNIRPKPKTRINEPAQLTWVAAAVAAHRNETLEQLSTATEANFDRLFLSHHR